MNDSYEIEVPKKPIRLKKAPRNLSRPGMVIDTNEESKQTGYLKKEMYKNDKYAQMFENLNNIIS